MAIDFAIIREGDVVKGFKLTASGGRLEDEQYCFSFPFAQREEKAGVVVKGKMIIFTHLGFSGKMIGSKNKNLDSRGGTVVRDITEEEGRALDALLHCKGAYEGLMLRARILPGKKKGFEVTAEKKGLFSHWEPSKKIGTHIGCDGVVVQEKKGLRCVKCGQTFWQG